MELSTSEGSARLVLGELTNSPRDQPQEARTKTPRVSPSMSPRQLAMAAQRPSFPYLKQQNGDTGTLNVQNRTNTCKHTPSKEHLGTLLASLRVDHPQIGVKKIKVKVQEQEPSWKVGCKEIRHGLKSTPVRTALALHEHGARSSTGMLEASFRTSSLDLSCSDGVPLASPERSKSESSLIECMRASMASYSETDRIDLKVSPGELSLVERMKACAVEDAVLDPSHVSTDLGPLSAPIETTTLVNDGLEQCPGHEKLVPPPPPPRVEDLPPPLPPRDLVGAAFSARKLGLRWKFLARQAAVERDAQVKATATSAPQDAARDMFSVGECGEIGLISTIEQRLVPPLPPPRVEDLPPPLPPRDLVGAAFSARKLGLRWKFLARQAAVERDAPAHIESYDKDLLEASCDTISTGDGEDSERDLAAERRRRAFLETASNSMLSAPVMQCDHTDLHGSDKEDGLGSPTIEARSRRSAFLRQELTDHALLRSAEKFIAARTLSSLEEMQMSPLRTLSWSNEHVERTGSSSSSSSSSGGGVSGSSGGSDSEGLGQMSFEQLTAKLLSAAQVAPSSESRTYLTQLYKTMTGLADEKNRLAEQLRRVQIQADESDAKLKELQDCVQTLAAKTSAGVRSSGSSTSLTTELPTPAPRIALIVPGATADTGTAEPSQQRQQAHRKRGRSRRGAVGCACGSRPAAETRESPLDSAHGSISAVPIVKPGTEWTAAIFDKYSEDPSHSQRILLPVDGAEQALSDRRRLASASLADLVEIVYLPRLARLSQFPVPHASEPFSSLLPRSSWNEDGPEWVALTSRFGISNGFAGGFSREQYLAWDTEVARACASCAAAGATAGGGGGAAAATAATAATPHSENKKSKRRWGRRSKQSAASSAAAPVMTSLAAQYLLEHYNALEAGGEHQLTPSTDSVGSNESLPSPLMPTVSANLSATNLQDEATQDAVAILDTALRAWAATE